MLNNKVFFKSYKGELFAEFNKTAASQQAMAIYGSYGFLFYHGGSCDVMDLSTRRVIANFHAASYTGDGNGPLINHANQAVFSNEFYEPGDPFPLLSITAGNSGEADKDGYYGRCKVERILMETNSDGKKKFSSQLIQTIIYNDNHWLVDEKRYFIEKAISKFERPCWGWPAFFPDKENNKLYLFSARYRTNGKFREYDKENAYIITTFSLPDPKSEGNTVILYPTDILDQFTTEYEVEVTQGGTLYGGRIYYSFGFGGKEFPNRIRVFDLSEKRIIAKLELKDSIFADEEIESCQIYKGMLLCNTNSGRLYNLGPLDDLM
ncbi:MAG: hypothetical protein GX957_14085 [Clostridiaceae bacterium]|nr:hypothetical protein [Clostridiaceae bacterium]